MFYSKTTNGFYTVEINGSNIPSDAVPISEDTHLLLLEGQAKGQLITSDDSGNPILKDRPVITYLADLTPRQIRQALTRAGLRTQVETAITAGSQDLKDWWEFASAFERNHPEVIAMGTALGQTSAQLDGLWSLGITL
jgi:hypothetical protein